MKFANENTPIDHHTNQFYEMLNQKVEEKKKESNKKNSHYRVQYNNGDNSVSIVELKNDSYEEKLSIKISKKDFMKNNQLDNQKLDLIAQAIANEDMSAVIKIIDNKERFNDNLIHNNIDNGYHDNIQRSRSSSNFNLLNQNNINNRIDNNNQINDVANRIQQNVIFDGEERYGEVNLSRNARRNFVVNGNHGVECNLNLNSDGCNMFCGCNII